MPVRILYLDHTSELGGAERWRKRPQRERAELAEFGSEAHVRCLRVVVHPCDRRAGDDVVELQGERLAPRGVAGGGGEDLLPLALEVLLERGGGEAGEGAADLLGRGEEEVAGVHRREDRREHRLHGAGDPALRPEIVPPLERMEVGEDQVAGRRGLVEHRGGRDLERDLGEGLGGGIAGADEPRQSALLEPRDRIVMRARKAAHPDDADAQR